MGNDVMMHFDAKTLCPTMTKDEIRTKAPYIFAEAPTRKSVSDRYVFANTETIIDDMEKLGWGVTDCKQQRATKKQTGKSFHMVAFQNPDVYIENDEGGIEGFVRIILTNSHDGFHSFKFMVGVYRCICSNGLIIASERFADISIRHINYDFEELRKIVAQAISASEKNVDIINDMRETKLTGNQKAEFAKKAIAIRKGVEVEELPKMTDKEVEAILEPVRNEDKGDDVWAVFNVLQEKVIKGDFTFGTTKKGKARKARPITGAAKDIEVNQRLFETATSYLVAA